MKALSVLGSTGSIGTQTLQIVDDFPDRFKVVALTAANNLELLVEQIKRHGPEVVALADGDRINELQERLNALELSRPLPQLLGGSDGICTAAAWASADLVVTGIVG
ncbi:MAG: 1-deoxy-D-xylulose-5-phosphate reductoisomerase, partial [Synechococcaceae bacterium WBB_34_004]|nr:1-deoxy-D-xylulose-5-phosphate reductoisomerase [Synechococcaceae bacterium WBB_34_004]